MAPMTPEEQVMSHEPKVVIVSGGGGPPARHQDEVRREVRRGAWSAVG